MIRELREERIGREEVYAKYFSMVEPQDCGMSATFYDTIERAKRLFGNSKKMVVLIRGQIFTQDGNLSYCTFLDNEYNIDKHGLEDALRDMDLFNAFMRNTSGENIDNKGLYFCAPENLYVSQKVVATAKLVINVE